MNKPSSGSGDSIDGSAKTNNNSGNNSKKRNRGKWNGKNSFENYKDASTTRLHPENVCSGDECPCCHKGKMYESEDRKLLQFTGNRPVEVSRYLKTVYRCNNCGYMVANNKNIEKWTNSSRSSIILQRIYGMPFYRLSQIQTLSGVPISCSTLWEQYLYTWNEGGAREIFGWLLGTLAECKDFKIDDTSAKILSVIKDNKLLKEQGKKKGRSCYSTTICSKTASGEVIILYLTGNKHAGENIGNILKIRQDQTSSITIMRDASSNNNPVLREEEYKWLLNLITIINCLAHGQRKFVELEQFYPEECGYFLEQTGGIYHNEHQCNNMNLSLEDKLKYHQEHSAKYISNVYNKIDQLFNEKKVEPNSKLGQAIRYWINNKAGLTQFLKVPLESLDNNWAERSLKTLILQRKNSLFFKTIDSAVVHSGMTSIVKTCSENSINAFKYLNWLQDNCTKAKKDPIRYTPFAYTKYMNDTELIKAA